MCTQKPVNKKHAKCGINDKDKYMQQWKGHDWQYSDTPNTFQFHNTQGERSGFSKGYWNHSSNFTVPWFYNWVNCVNCHGHLGVLKMAFNLLLCLSPATAGLHTTWAISKDPPQGSCQQAADERLKEDCCIDLVCEKRLQVFFLFVSFFLSISTCFSMRYRARPNVS